MRCVAEDHCQVYARGTCGRRTTLQRVDAVPLESRVGTLRDCLATFEAFDVLEALRRVKALLEAALARAGCDATLEPRERQGPRE